MFKVLFFLSLLFAQAVFASWKVESLRGDAWLDSGQKTSSLKLGQSIHVADKIRTGKNTRLKISFKDSSIWLGQNTTFVVPKPKEEKREESFLFKVLRGKVRAKVKPGDFKDFEVATPTAVAGVRGTEFFVSAEKNESFICTLTGKVNVKKVKASKNIDVPMCAGVGVSEASNLNLRPTDSRQVAMWVAETSTEERPPIVIDEYKLQAHTYHPLKGNWYYKNKVFANLVFLNNTNYGATDDEKNAVIGYSRFMPGLRYQSKISVTLEPRIYIGEASSKFKFSKAEAGTKKISKLRLGESFLETNLGNANVKLGLQGIKWNDGNLLSRDFWGVDEYLYPSLRVQTPLNDDYYLDFFVAEKGSEQELSSQVPVKLQGLKMDFRAWADLYVLRREYSPEDSFSSLSLFDHHEVVDIGLHSGHRLTRWDYDFFYNYQTGDLFKKGTQKESKESSVGFHYGYYPYPNKDIRFGLGFHRASENYLPGFESPFLMGYSQLLKRTNVQQFRFKLGFGINDRWTLNIEQIKNTSINSGSFSAWSGDEKELFDELDVGFLYDNKRESVKALIALFYVSPRLAWSTATSKDWDEGTGLVLNIQKSF